MSRPLAQRAGSALLWQGGQYAAVNALFFARLFVLARLLDPEAFGLVAIAMVATDLLLRFTDFGLIPALIQHAGASDRHYHSAWSWGVVRAAAVWLGAVLAAPLVAKIFDEPAAISLVQVLAARPLLGALASIRIAELNRNLRFRAIATIKIPEALVNTVVSIALAPWLGVWGLVAGMLAGSSVYLLASYLVAPWRPRLVFDRAASRRLLAFGRWIFLSGLVVVFGSFVLRAVVSRQLGATELGLYFLATRLAFFPSNLADEVVGAVAFPLFGRLQSDPEEAARAFRSLLTGLTALLVPVCALLMATAPELVRSVLGSRWGGTAPLIQVLAIASAVGLLGDTMVPLFKAMGQPFRVTVLEVIQSALLITGALVLVPLFGGLGAALAWVPALAVAQFVGAAMLTTILPRVFPALAAPMACIVFASLLGAGVARLALHVAPGIGGLALGLTAAPSVIAVTLWQLDRRLSLGLVAGLDRVFPQLTSLLGRAHGLAT